VVGFAEALEPDFERDARRVVDNVRGLGDRLREHGLSLVSGGTDTHLVLVDLRPSHPDTPGGVAEEALEAVGVGPNKNTVPGETRAPLNPFGIRAGTPTPTTRGCDEAACKRVADVTARVVDAPEDESVGEEAPAEVAALCEEYPQYAGGAGVTDYA